MTVEDTLVDAVPAGRVAPQALRVRGLTVRYGGASPAVEGVDLDVAAGEVVALLGVSGSGKSSIVNALLGLLPAGAGAAATELAFGATPVDLRDRRQVRAVRGRRVGLVPQDCTVALDPVLRVGPQILEGVAEARSWTPERRRARVAELLASVGFADPDAVVRRYPHELSGGMAQRVLIALALAGRPELLIADEPSAALDTLTQAAVMDTIAELAERERVGVLLVTHDVALAAQRAHRGVLLERGSITRTGAVRTLVAPTRAAPVARPAPVGPDLLRVEAVQRLYPGARGPTGVHDVSLELPAGAAVGLVGGSGAGKSTLARLIAGLEEPDRGSVRYRGQDLRGLGRAARRDYRRAVQLVAQNPFSSIDPRYTARRAIEEPLRAFRLGDRATRAARVDALADLVRLPRAVLGHTPDRLSGGQCQRVAIARALATGPAALICDEVVSALDHTAKQQVIELLGELRGELGLAVVFITHDLSAAAALTDRLVVLRDGLVVEAGPTARLLTAARHDYTRELVAATPPPVSPSDTDREQSR